MAWTAPYTAVAGGIVAAADFNVYVRDNLLVTEASLAQTPGSLFIGTGVNSITERVPAGAQVDTSESLTSSAYADLPTPGPAVAVASGTKAIVCVGARIGPVTVATASVKMSWAVSGATTRAADDQWAAGGVALGTSGVVYTSRWYLATGLTAGNNTFTAKYASSSGTATYQYRSIHVIPL